MKPWFSQSSPPKDHKRRHVNRNAIEMTQRAKHVHVTLAGEPIDRQQRQDKTRNVLKKIGILS